VDRCNAYGHFAAKCVELARRMESSRDRSVMLQMALAWLRLAEYAAKTAARESQPAASHHLRLPITSQF
jgi:hypothetical protein